MSDAAASALRATSGTTSGPSSDPELGKQDHEVSTDDGSLSNFSSRAK